MNNNQKKNKETIFVIGNFNIDLIFYPVNRQIRWGEERTVDNMIVRSAGSAGYTTHTLASLGIVPKIIGNLGNDHYGKTIIKSLESYGIVTKNLRIENCPTGISITVVNSKGERAFITYLGHLKHFTSKTATEYLLNISKIDYVMFSGYFLLPSLSEKGAIDILTLCKEKGALILFDPGWDPMGWKPNKINEIKRILEYVDIFIPNKEEAYAITNKNIAEEAVCNLLKLGPKKVIVKMGNKGSVFKEMDSNSVFVPQF
jgi:ribokinase